MEAYQRQKRSQVKPPCFPGGGVGGDMWAYSSALTHMLPLCSAPLGGVYTRIQSTRGLN